MRECIIPMPGRTEAEKGKRAARARGIRAAVVSVDPSVTKNGCSFGLEVPCVYGDDLMYLFDRERITHGEMIGRVL